MTINWDIAPGVTHFYEDEFGMRVGRKWFIWDDLYREWRPHELNQHNFLLKAAIRRPIEDLAWTGEGLPPVGTVCEYDARAIGKGDPLWVTVKVHYLSQWTIVFECIAVPEGTKQENVGVELSVNADAMTSKRFRPIRTPEQIAAEERESGIEGIRKAVSSSTNCKAHGLDWDVAGAIYDAGYRKEVKS